MVFPPFHGMATWAECSRMRGRDRADPGSYLGEAPGGLGREGHVRADSTSVWPRLVTELREGRRGTSPRGGSWEGGQGQQASREAEEAAGSPVDVLPFSPELLLKTRQNQELSGPRTFQHRTVSESWRQVSSERI